LSEGNPISGLETAQPSSRVVQKPSFRVESAVIPPRKPARGEFEEELALSRRNGGFSRAERVTGKFAHPEEYVVNKAGFILSVLGLAVGALSPSVDAQFLPGSFVVGTTDTKVRALLVSPQGPWSTLATINLSPIWSMVPSAHNRSVWLTAGSLQSGVFEFTSAGAFNTVFLVTPGYRMTGLVLDGNGDVYLTGSAGQVLKRSGGQITTVVGGIRWGVFGLTEDPNDGALLLGVQEGVVRMTTHGPHTMNWVRKDPSLSGIWPVGIQLDPVTGYLLEVRSGKITRYDRARSAFAPPTPPLPQPFTSLGTLVRDPATGLFVVAGTHQTNGVLLFRYDATNNVVTWIQTLKHATNSRHYATVTIPGTRYLSSLGPVGPGQTLKLRVSCPSAPHRPYFVGLSLAGWWPGMSLAGRTIYLNPDALFFQSLTAGAYFRDFVGALDSKGEAVASVQLPNVRGLSGLRVHAASLILPRTPALPVVSSPFGFTIQ